MKHFLQIILSTVLFNNQMVKSLSPDEDDPQESFNICPSDFTWAFDKGRQCCNASYLQFTETECEKFTGSCEEGSDCSTAVPCPNGNLCESFNINCQSFILVTSDDTYSGSYSTNPNMIEANRPVYSREGNCFWWFRKERHWLVGPCENVGTDDGYAYLTTDVNCPDEEYENDKWILKETKTPWLSRLSGYAIAFFAEGSVLTEDSATTALSTIQKEDGKYSQRCKWVFKNGKFACSRKKND